MRYVKEKKSMPAKKKLILKVGKSQRSDQTVLFGDDRPPMGPYDQPDTNMPFWPAPEVKLVLDEMRNLHHSDLCEPDIQFHCLFSPTPIRVRGSDAAATIQPISGANCFLWQYAQHTILAASAPDGSPGREVKRDFSKKPIVPVPIFVVKVWVQWWINAQEWERMALCDHELCHAVINENDETGIRSAASVGHDVEEFQKIVQRWGAWNRGLAALIAEHRNGKMMRQASGIQEYD